MKNLCWIGLLLSLFFAVRCGSDETDETVDPNEGVATLDTNQFLVDLKEMENKIDANVNNADTDLLKEAVTTYQDFAGIFPKDPKAPDYLLKASDFALITAQPEKSVKILDRIIREYPDYGKMEDVMYNRASHLDIELRDTTLAKQAYQDFIDKFPKATNKVLDAQFRIQTISLTLEELSDQYMDQMESGQVE